MKVACWKRRVDNARHVDISETLGDYIIAPEGCVPVHAAEVQEVVSAYHDSGMQAHASCCYRNRGTYNCNSTDRHSQQLEQSYAMQPNEGNCACCSLLLADS